jgi:glycosyltransferase involved in cell wall biosynthesis
MRKKNVALYQQILTKSDLRGPSYFFPMFNIAYNQEEQSRYNIIYLLKTDNKEALIKGARNKEFNAPNIIFMPERNHRFKKIHETLDLLYISFKHKLVLIHFCTFTTEDTYFPLKWISKLPSLLRPKFTLSITYNGHAPAFLNNYQGRFSKYQERHQDYKDIKWSGVLSWFTDIFEFAQKSKYFGEKPIVATVESRFCDMQVFHPEEKEKIIYWAGALETYKQPKFYLEAIRLLYEENPELIRDWKFIMLGSGPLHDMIQSFIAEHNLSSVIETLPTQPDYFKLVNKSMAHVSTQELDHFPNLVINEAMAGGCAILATNVGRIGLFVQDGANGFLSKTEDAQGIKAILEKFISMSDADRNKMLETSRHLCEQNHSPLRFIEQIDRFWGEVLG